MRLKLFSALFILFSLSITKVSSQQIYQKTILNSVSIRGLVQLEENKIAFITNDPANWDSLLLSVLDSSGSIIVQKSLNISGLSYESIEMEKTLDNGLIILCHNSSCLIKIDSAFNLEWMRGYRKSLTNLIGGSVKQLEDSGYIVCGTVLDTLPDKLLFRTDKHGLILWSKMYNSAAYEKLNSIALTNDNGFIVAGGNGAPYSACGISIIRTDSIGNIVWAKIYGDIGDEAKAISQTDDGGFIICGGNDVAGSVFRPATILKIDSAGNLAWIRMVRSSGNSYHSGAQVGQMFDGNYFMGGIRNPTHSGNDYDVFLIKFDNNGDTLWSHVYGDVGKEKAFHFIQTSSNNFVIGGEASYNSFGLVGYNAYLLKTDSFGNGGCNELERNFEILGSVNQVRMDSIIGSNANITSYNITTSSSIGSAQIQDLCSSTNITSNYHDYPEIALYPNPTNNFVYLMLSSISKNISYQISDSKGSIVCVGNINEEQRTTGIIEIELSKILNQSGSYLITILSDLEIRGAKKFVFNK